MSFFVLQAKKCLKFVVYCEISWSHEKVPKFCSLPRNFWLQMTAKFVAISFAQPIIPIFEACGDDFNCAHLYSEFFCHFYDIHKGVQI